MDIIYINNLINVYNNDYIKLMPLCTIFIIALVTEWKAVEDLLLTQITI